MRKDSLGSLLNKLRWLLLGLVSVNISMLNSLALIFLQLYKEGLIGYHYRTGNVRLDASRADYTTRTAVIMEPFTLIWFAL